MPFPAFYDRSTKITSAVVCLGLLAVIFAVHNLILTVLSLLVLAIAFAWSPRGYVVEGQSILVRRLAGTVRIPLADVRQVRRADNDDLRGCIRLWGSGGLFGYYGLFSTSKLGKSTWYVTDRGKIVVVVTGSKTLLFSPQDAGGFLQTVRAAAPQTAVTQPQPEFLQVASATSGKWIGIAIALAAVGLVTAAMLYSPGPPSYTITPDALTIHDRFYPVTLHAAAVDINGIRIVDLNLNNGWRPLRRADGFANPYYQCGWFQVANGDKVRLYRAGGARVVLLPPKGASAAVLYQAANPESFVEQLRTAWAQTARSTATSPEKPDTNAGK